jgi:tRNA (guanine26-N2/guanine27-N2)-dimethyltransferase
MQKITEGMVEIATQEGVFYNRQSRYIRDLSVAFLKNRAEGKSVIDSTAASGVRGIRYLIEDKAETATFVDRSKKACNSIKKNLGINKVKGDIVNSSFQEFANTSKKRFDIIDIDPFGSPIPFIYDAFKIARNNGILMVTATDTIVLCGADRKACIKNYGAIPMHNELCHESGLRILLAFIARNAAQFNFGIEPLLSVAELHYMRVFLRLDERSTSAIDSVKSIGIAGFCINCHGFEFAKGIEGIRNECSNCGRKLERYGPMWLGKLQDKKTVDDILREKEMLDNISIGLVEKISDEIDVPFFYQIPKVTKYLKTGSVKVSDVIKKLSKKHKASRTNFDSSSIKTDASVEQVISAVRACTNRNAKR